MRIPGRLFGRADGATTLVRGGAGRDAQHYLGSSFFFYGRTAVRAYSLVAILLDALFLPRRILPVYCLCYSWWKALSHAAGSCQIL